MWILFLFGTVVGGEGGRGVTAVEFSNQQSCVAAVKQSLTQKEFVKHAFCVKK